MILKKKQKNMLILSGANKKYKIFLENLKNDIKRFGYRFKEIKIDQSFPEKFEKDVYKAKIKNKPEIILENMEEGFNVYMDSDIRILKDFSEVKGSYDIGFTAHDPKYHDGKLRVEANPHITGYVNAGVIFINNNERSRRFIKEWIAERPYTATGSDQEALTNLLRRHVRLWKGNTEVLGAKIRLYPSDIYNSREDRTEAKIRHYTGTYDKKIKDGICAVSQVAKEK